MPRLSTFPPLYNVVKNVSIVKLKEWGYLKPNQYINGTITWSRHYSITGEVSICINTKSKSPYIELRYKHSGSIINYKVLLVSVFSNLGKGKIWYFLCPITKKRCRKLYLVRDKFLHRSAFKNCMYESQTWSKKARQNVKKFDQATGGEKASENLYKKHFKQFYNGKPTKRYLQLMKQINQSRKFSATDIEMLYIL